MDSSQFSDNQPRFEAIEQMETQGATCDTFRVKLYGKLHFLKRLKSEYAGDIRYQEALRKEFETGYRLEHPNLVRYLSLDKDSILMEYVDGETLSQLLTQNPDYFKQRKNTEILLTHINDDVKLIDLGFCYTDTFADTQGHTNAFAAPEQLSTPRSLSLSKGPSLTTKTDIYAFGKILELLPDHSIYNKVIARCTAERPEDRYQSVEEILHAINHQRRYFLWVAIIVFCAALLFAGLALLTHQKVDPSAIEKIVADSVVSEQQDTLQQMYPLPVSKPTQQKPAKDEQTPQKEDLDRMMDQAYRSTIATFCDSVFPSPTPSTGKAWADASTEFHNQTVQIGERLIKKYPSIPETTIRQETEARFQSLVSSVFTQMRQNGKQ